VIWLGTLLHTSTQYTLSSAYRLVNLINRNPESMNVVQCSGKSYECSMAKLTIVVVGNIFSYAQNCTLESMQENRQVNTCDDLRYASWSRGHMRCKPFLRSVFGAKGSSDWFHSWYKPYSFGGQRSKKHINTDRSVSIGLLEKSFTDTQCSCCVRSLWIIQLTCCLLISTYIYLN